MNTITLTKDILNACSYVAEHHAEEKRNDGKTPFINHILEVVNFLIANGITDRDVLVASVLHDSLNYETEEEISKIFGEAVLKIVKECTVDNSLNSVERKQHLLDIASGMSQQVKLIYLADLYSNVSFLLNHTPSGWSNGMIKGYIYWSMLMYEKLNNINKEILGCFATKFAELLKQHHHRCNIDLYVCDLWHRVEIYFEILKDRYSLN